MKLTKTKDQPISFVRIFWIPSISGLRVSGKNRAQTKKAKIAVKPIVKGSRSIFFSNLPTVGVCIALPSDTRNLRRKKQDFCSIFCL